MTAPRVIAVLLVTTLGAACGREPAASPVEPPAVCVAPVAKGALSEWLHLSGRVVPLPDHDATLSPRVDGVLSEVTVRLGERVSRGQVLARVGTSDLADALSSAVAAEQSAAADAEAKRRAATRTRTLVGRGVVSGEQAETTRWRPPRRRRCRRRRRRARCLPNAGVGPSSRLPSQRVVLRVLRHAGEPVDGTAATPVVEIAAEQPVQVALDATAAVLARLSEGQAAEIVLDTPAATPISARVSGVARSVDAATGTGPVRLDPSAADASLLLGRVVEARIVVARHEGVLVVPASALRGGADGVVEAIVVKDHKSHVVTVVAGIHDGDRVEVVSGLAEGDVIVVDDPVGLGDDAPVRDGP
jgi:multidrug efflux pump subunit AcrA (membrane-fusion protein)